jgi:AcrR family transcriptional regulator
MHPMAHEVVKQVGTRAYRYSVESYRDPASGKVRGRWTYLGRVDAGTEPRRRGAEASAVTRERLLEALERLLEGEDFARIGADDIATEAGVAHGTFYRHFGNKRAALIAVFERAKAEIERSRPSFDAPLGDLDAERRRVRGWVESALGSPLGRPGFLRAWYATIATDVELSEARRARRADSAAAFAAYLARLDSAGLARIERPESLANALLALFDGVFRSAVLDAARIDATTVAGASDVFERAIFPRPA